MNAIIFLIFLAVLTFTAEKISSKGSQELKIALGMSAMILLLFGGLWFTTEAFDTLHTILRSR